MKKIILAFIMVLMVFGIMATLGACDDDSGLQEIRRTSEKAQKAVDDMKKSQDKLDELLKKP